MRTLLPALPLLFALLHAAGAAAQAPASGALARLRAGTDVRVHTASGELLEGGWLAHAGDSLMLRDARGAQLVTVQLARVDSLLARGRATGRYAGRGAIAGGLLGLGVCVVASEFCVGPGLTAGFVIATTGVGALVGTVIGHGRDGPWRLRWARASPGGKDATAAAGSS